MSVIDGVHYIFDRYAFLNNLMESNNRSVRITPDSPKDRVRKAITLALALYHPDRQENSAREMKQKAEEMSHMLSDCKRFLLNDDVRPLYNARLQKFKDEKPDYVSTTGTPIINPHDSYFDVDTLIDEEIPDTKRLEDYVQGLTQFNENSFAQMQSLYQTMPDNPQIRELYKEALVKKYVHLNLMEEIAWKKLGFSNLKNKTEGLVTQADDYLEQVNKALAQVREREIQTSLQSRHEAALIGLSKMPLLLSFNGQAKSSADYALMKPEEQQQIIEKITQTARAHFDQRTSFVQDIAQQKQQILAALMPLTPIWALSPADPSDPVYHVFLVEPEDNDTIVFWATLDKDNSKVSPQIWTGDDSLAAVTAQGLKANSFALARNKELDGNLFLLELMSAITRICEEQEAKAPGMAAEQPATSPRAAPPPAPKPGC